MTLISVPQSGKCGPVVYVNTKFGIVVRQRVVPHNPRTQLQMANRGSFATASKYWGTLSDDQQAQWCARAATQYTITASGLRVPLSGYSFCVRVNTRQANLGLPLFDLPPAPPTFSSNPVAELVATNDGGNISLKLQVPTPPAQPILLQGAAPQNSGVRCVQHFPKLGLLPAPVDGWSDITALVLAKYHLLRAGQRIFIRTCQHINGWSDIPKVVSVRIPAATP